MAQTDITQPTGKQRAGVRKILKSAPRIDMTPMVDLGFLLISFFVIVSQLQEPTTMSIAVPKDTRGPQNQVGKSYAFTVLLNGNTNYYYEGHFDEAKKNNQIFETSIEGLRQAIIQKQQQLDDKIKYPEGRKGLVMMIKPTPEASYKSMVDVLDECTITHVEKYALVKLNEEEGNWLMSK